jgi:hypothetical protein
MRDMFDLDVREASLLRISTPNLFFQKSLIIIFPYLNLSVAIKVQIQITISRIILVLTPQCLTNIFIWAQSSSLSEQMKMFYSVQLNLFAEKTLCTANAAFRSLETTNWGALEDVIRVLATAALIGTLITVGALLPFG